MPREHVEFIQAQALSWSSDVSWLPIAAEQKRLSVDPDSGAQSAIMRLAAGSSDGDHTIAADEELFVLRGSMTVGNVTLEEGDYAFWPAGYPRPSVCSDGCDYLSFLESGPVAATRSDYDSTSTIERLNTRSAEWGGATDKRVAAASISRLQLRPDNAIGERTWLLRLSISDGQRFPMNGVEEHPCVEEMFLLDGDIAMTTGTLRQGAYFWRPPHIKHGPIGSTTGFTALFRAKEGPFETTWSEPETDIPWDAAYNPILPQGMQVPAAGYDPAQPY